MCFLIVSPAANNVFIKTMFIILLFVMTYVLQGMFCKVVLDKHCHIQVIVQDVLAISLLANLRIPHVERQTHLECKNYCSIFSNFLAFNLALPNPYCKLTTVVEKYTIIAFYWC